MVGEGGVECGGCGGGKLSGKAMGFCSLEFMVGWVDEEYPCRLGLTRFFIKNLMKVCILLLR